MEELTAQGHSIEYDNYSWGTLDEFDLVIGPTCWRMTPELTKYLKDAVKAARAIKYPKEVKSANNEGD